MARSVEIDRQRRLQLSGVLILAHMVDTPADYPLLLEGDEAALEPVLEWLYERDYVEIEDDQRYVVGDKGRKVLSRFMGRYHDFLCTMDVYSAVDLEEGIFAYERFFDFETDVDFSDYLESERWEDLRVAVAELKGIDPVEIVFMSFLREERVTPEGSARGNTLLDGAHWEEIREIVETAIEVSELAFEDDGPVSGQEVLERIVTEGAELNIELKKRESELEGAVDRGSREGRRGDVSANGEEEELVEEYTVERYESYLDPFYVSPVWMGVWLL